jgi:dynein heavy chain 1
MDVGVLRGVTSQLGLLEVELMRSQQSIEIPHITLSVHRVIAEFIRKQRAAGKTPKVEDFDVAFTDSFLLELQRGISDWKKLIMRVTKLTRDVLSGSTIQEINFWLGMESAIHHIYDEKDSAGVALTFDVLKAANCHFAIANFNLEVGLAERKDEDKGSTPPLSLINMLSHLIDSIG